MQRENWKIRIVGHISDHQWGAVIRGGVLSVTSISSIQVTSISG